MRIGEFEVLPVIDGKLVVPAKMFFPKLSADDWAPHKQFLDSEERLDMPVGGFLIRGNGILALVDAGFGPVEGYPDLGGRLIESLKALGHEPSDITDVLFSHLHFDHIGWASQNGVGVFPNATYRCHAKDYDYFVTQNTHQGRFAESLGISPYADAWLAPVTDRIETWDGDVTVLPGIDVKDAPGHTPGSTVIVISSGAERGVLLGDAAHCPAELLEAEWETIADVDAGLARRTREALAREYEGTDVVVAAPHFPDMQFGRLLPGQARPTWVVA
jgi:glyoxylase-like metal-dependent hydrolase (beta-lactamase superfamily II)